MSTEPKPKEESGGSGNKPYQPSNGDGRELCHNQYWDLVRQLDEKLKRPSFLLTSKHADCNKWKQKRDRDIKGAESGHERQRSPRHKARPPEKNCIRRAGKVSVTSSIARGRLEARPLPWLAVDEG